jgi:hypothetical protein
VFIHCAGDRGRAWAAEMLVGEFGEHSVQIRARLSALGEVVEAQSSTSGLLHRCVGAMTQGTMRVTAAVDKGGPDDSASKHSRLFGRLTTLSHNGRVMGNGLRLIRGHS